MTALPKNSSNTKETSTSKSATVRGLSPHSPIEMGNRLIRENHKIKSAVMIYTWEDEDGEATTSIYSSDGASNTDMAFFSMVLQSNIISVISDSTVDVDED